METITIPLVIIASILQIWGHIVYNKKVGTEPNITSWTIWGLTSVLDTWNYSAMTGDWQKNILSYTCSTMCLITWVICLFRGKFQKLEWEDCVGFVICITAMVVWKYFGLTKESNVLLQVDNLISFIPIIVGVARHPEKETPQPWLWWTASYSLGTLVVIMRYQQWQDLLYPAGCAILHLIVAVFALRKYNNNAHNTTRPLPV